MYLELNRLYKIRFHYSKTFHSNSLMLQKLSHNSTRIESIIFGLHPEIGTLLMIDACKQSQTSMPTDAVTYMCFMLERALKKNNHQQFPLVFD